jgi:hypothetical protein
LQQSPVVRTQVGEPKDQRLALFDGFSYSTAGTEAEASFRRHVRGSEASAVMDMRLERILGQWILMDGNLVDEEGRVYPLLSKTPDATEPSGSADRRPSVVRSMAV